MEETPLKMLLNLPEIKIKSASLDTCRPPDICTQLTLDNMYGFPSEFIKYPDKCSGEVATVEKACGKRNYLEKMPYVKTRIHKVILGIGNEFLSVDTTEQDKIKYEKIEEEKKQRRKENKKTLKAIREKEETARRINLRFRNELNRVKRNNNKKIKTTISELEKEQNEKLDLEFKSDFLTELDNAEEANKKMIETWRLISEKLVEDAEKHIIIKTKTLEKELVKNMKAELNLDKKAINADDKAMLDEIQYECMETFQREENELRVKSKHELEHQLAMDSLEFQDDTNKLETKIVKLDQTIDSMYVEIINLHAANLRYKEDHKNIQIEFDNFVNSLNLSTCKMLPQKDEVGKIKEILPVIPEKLHKINERKKKLNKHKNVLTNKEKKKHSIHLLEEIELIKKLKIKEKLKQTKIEKRAERERQYIIAKREELKNTILNKIKMKKKIEHKKKIEVDNKSSAETDQINNEVSGKSKKGKNKKRKTKKNGNKSKSKKSTKKKGNKSVASKVKNDKNKKSRESKKKVNTKNT